MLISIYFPPYCSRACKLEDTNELCELFTPLKISLVCVRTRCEFIFHLKKVDLVKQF